MIAGHELLVVDPKRSGSTQYVNAADLAGAVAAARKGGAAVVGMTNGRLVSLTDGREYAIGTGRAVIGREADCDVVLDSKSVSRKHCEIMSTDKGYLLVDLSTNGTFVNGEKVPGQRILARADVIRVGDHDLRFYADAPKGGGQPAPQAAAPAPQPAPAAPAPAPAAAPPPQAPKAAAPPPAAAARLNDTLHGTPAAAPAPGPLASLLIRTGPKKGTRVPIRVPVINIGRADYNDVVLAEESVSTQHAKLQRREGVWVLVDLGSTNGTFVDGEKVEGEVPVAPGATLRFGDASVVFEPTDDALGIGKGGAGTKVMGAVNVAPAPKPAPAAPAPAPAASAPAPKAAPAKPAAKPAAKAPAPKAPPAGGAPKWLVPAIILLVVAAAAAYFVLQR
jgi:pSer/pThr/pTyr-binding forkhead associated (FHA) protein